MPHLTNEGRTIATKHAKELFEESKSISITMYSQASDDGLNKIGAGFGREVFTLPEEYVSDNNPPSNGYIIKFPIASEHHDTANGKAQNGYEIESWEKRLSQFQDHLVPIFDYHDDGWWVAMPKADEADNDSPEAQDKIDELENNGLEFNDEIELGWHEGELRLLDYGYGVSVE